MSRRYLAVLAAVAVLILAGGLAVRRRLLPSAPARAAAAAPPSEAATLRTLTQAAQLDRMAGYLAARVAAAAPQVTHVADVGAGGVRWRGDTVLTTSDAAPVVVRRAAAGDTADAAAAAAAGGVDSTADAPAAGDWLLVVGRGADGRVVSATGISGGRQRVRCGPDDPSAGDGAVDAYVLNVPLADALAGAGVFDLDGRVLGLVARCAGGLAALPLRDALRLAGDGAAPPLGRYGVALAPLDARARAYAGADAGLFVAAVRRGGPADAAGLRVGDVVLPAGGTADGPADVGVTALLAGIPTAGELRVTRQRGRARALVRVAPPAPDTAAADLAFAPDAVPPAAPAGVRLERVRANSPAAAAGLRAGDRLVRVDDAAVTDAAQAARLLAAAPAAPAAGRPALLVVLRDGVERALWLPPAPAAAAPVAAGDGR